MNLELLKQAVRELREYRGVGCNDVLAEWAESQADALDALRVCLVVDAASREDLREDFIGG